MSIDALATTVFGALVGFAVWYIQSRLDKIRREQERLHDERRKLYTEILEPFVRMFAGVKTPTETKKALEQLLSFEYRRTAFEFSLIGADDVVTSFNDMMQYVYSFDSEAGQTPSTKELLRRWGSFLLAIRRSVGNPKTKLSPADMLRSQVKSIDDVFK